MLARPPGVLAGAESASEGQVGPGCPVSDKLLEDVSLGPLSGKAPILTLRRGPGPSRGRENAVSGSEGRAAGGLPSQARRPRGWSAAGLRGWTRWCRLARGTPGPPDGESLSLCCQPPGVPEGTWSLLAPSGDFNQTQAVCSSSRPQLEDITGAWRRRNFPSEQTAFPFRRALIRAPSPPPTELSRWVPVVACASRSQPQVRRPGGLGPAAPGREAEATPAAPRRGRAPSRAWLGPAPPAAAHSRLERERPWGSGPVSWNPRT